MTLSSPPLSPKYKENKNIESWFWKSTKTCQVLKLPLNNQMFKLLKALTSHKYPQSGTPVWWLMMFIGPHLAHFEVCLTCKVQEWHRGLGTNPVQLQIQLTKVCWTCNFRSDMAVLTVNDTQVHSQLILRFVYLVSLGAPFLSDC